MTQILVTTNADSGSGSLRDAIANASTGDVIRFDASLAGSTILLASTLNVDKTIEIEGLTAGDDAPNITIDGAGRYRCILLTSLATTTTLRNLVIQNATVYSPGGGVQISRATSRLVAHNCRFVDNTARQGACLYGSGDFYGCLFAGSTTTGSEGVGSNASGGAVCNPYGATANFDECLFSENISLGSGGAFYTATARGSFTRCQFVDNSAVDGAAIHAPADLQECEFFGNVAPDGSSVVLSGASSLVDQSEIDSIRVGAAVGVVVAHESAWDDATLDEDATITLNDAYLAIKSLDAPDGANVEGDGKLATNDRDALNANTSVALCDYGAGVADFSAQSFGAPGVLLSWTIEVEGKTVLLERQTADGWVVVDSTATSPTTAPVEGADAVVSNWRIWDGVAFHSTRAVWANRDFYQYVGVGVVGVVAQEWEIVTLVIRANSMGYRNENAMFLALVKNPTTSELLKRDDVASASATVYKTRNSWGGADSWTPVAGWTDVTITLDAVLNDPAPVPDDFGAAWKEETGPNFVWTPSTTERPLFPDGGAFVTQVKLDLVDGRNPVFITFRNKVL